MQKISLLGLASLWLLSSCGQSGTLYLPEPSDTKPTTIQSTGG